MSLLFIFATAQSSTVTGSIILSTIAVATQAQTSTGAGTIVLSVSANVDQTQTSTGAGTIVLSASANVGQTQSSTVTGSIILSTIAAAAQAQTSTGAGTIVLSTSAIVAQAQTLVASFNRASPATYFDFTGTLQTAAIDVPRIDYGPNPSSNYIFNSVASGVVPGTPGTMPTNWTTDGNGLVDGLSRQVVGSGVESSLNYVDVRFFGTSTALSGARNFIVFDTVANNPLAAFGQTWTLSYYTRLVAGSAANITLFAKIAEFNGASQLSVANSSTASNTAGTIARNTFQYKLTQATANGIQARINIQYASGAVIDVTIRVYAPQLEQDANASTWIPTNGYAVPPTSLGFLSETASTNGIRNPRGEGSTIGTVGAGGVLPTNWTQQNTGGISQAVIGSGFENGIPYVDIRAFGTTAGVATLRWAFETTTIITATNAQVWRNSTYLRLVAGTFANISNQSLGIFQYNSTPSLLSAVEISISTLTNSALATQRYSVAVTTNQATIASIIPTVGFSIPAAGAVDFTIRIGAPQLEQSPSATSVILPVIGTPLATTRAMDTTGPLISASLSTIVSQSNQTTATGSIVLSSASVLAQTQAITATGKIILSAVATETDTEVVTATGTVILSNASVLAQSRTITGIGAIALSGAVTGLQANLVTATPTVVLTASATGLQANLASATPSVVLTVSTTSTETEVITATGSIFLSATATQNQSIVGGFYFGQAYFSDGFPTDFVSSVGTIGLSTAATAAQTQAITATGKITLSVVATETATEVVTATGTVILSAASVLAQSQAITATGKITLSAVATETATEVVTATGTVILSAASVLAQVNSLLVGFNRASTATYFDVVGNLQTAAVNTLRFAYNPITLSPIGNLFETASTNGIRNPRQEGAIAGTPGTNPTNTTRFNSDPGGVQTIVGSGTENGLPYVDFLFSGTGVSPPYVQGLILETTTAIAALTGQTWTSSFYMKLVAGAFPASTTIWNNIQEDTSSGTGVTGTINSPALPTTASLATQRFVYTHTLAGGVTVGAVQSQIKFTINTSGAYSFTVRLAVPQLEQSASATSVILPVIGTPLAATRATDFTGPLISLSSTATGTDTETISEAGTIVLSSASQIAQTQAITAVGLINLSAVATETDTEIVSGIGTLVFSSAAIFAQSQTISASGSIALTTSANFTQTQAITAIGSISLSAVATETDTEVVTATGTVTLSNASVLDQSQAIVGIGVIALSGAATGLQTNLVSATPTVVLTASVTGSDTETISEVGTLVLSSAIIAAQTQAIIGIGEIFLSAVATETAAEVVTGIGTVILSSASVLAQSQTSSVTGSLIISATAIGTAAESATEAGTLVLSATSVFDQTQTITAIGTLLLSANIIAFESNITTVAGALIVSASALADQSFMVDATGVLVLSSQVNLAQTNETTAIGSIILSSVASSTQSQAISATGNLFLSIAPTLVIDATGTIVLSYSISSDGIKLVSGSGSLNLSADASTVHDEVIFATGSLFLSTTATIEQTQTISEVGSLVLSSDSLTAQTQTINANALISLSAVAAGANTEVVTGTGNVPLSNASVLAQSQTITGIGAIALSGAVTGLQTNLATATPTVVLAASATVTDTEAMSEVGTLTFSSAIIASQTQVISASGSIELSVAATEIDTEVVTATGNLFLFASATVDQAQTITATGSLILSTSAIFNRQILVITGVSATGAFGEPFGDIDSVLAGVFATGMPDTSFESIDYPVLTGGSATAKVGVLTETSTNGVIGATSIGRSGIISTMLAIGLDTSVFGQANVGSLLLRQQAILDGLSALSQIGAILMSRLDFADMTGVFSTVATTVTSMVSGVPGGLAASSMAGVFLPPLIDAFLDSIFAIAVPGRIVIYVNIFANISATLPMPSAVIQISSEEQTIVLTDQLVTVYAVPQIVDINYEADGKRRTIVLAPQIVELSTPEQPVTVYAALQIVDVIHKVIGRTSDVYGRQQLARQRG